MKNDRFLLGILIGIGLLVALTLGLFFLRQQQPNYKAEDTPAGVVHNYITAVELRDYERAYTYLAERTDKPTFEVFRQAFLTQMDPQSASVQVGEAFISGQDASVQVSLLHVNNGLFSSTWSEQMTATLVLQDGAWKLTNGPYPYWFWDWYQPVIKTP